MKKNKLMNGDMVVLHSGVAAVVIQKEHEHYLLWQKGGWESLDEYDEDMVYMYPDEDEYDAIMQVYRCDTGISFHDFEDDLPVYERDENWVRPTQEEMDRAEAERAAKCEAMQAEQQRSTPVQEDTRIRIIAQQFYGNRTGTEIRCENADYFLRGYMGPELDPADIRDVDRRVVRVPGSDNVVIVYDQKQEDNYVAVDFPELYAWHAEEYRKQTGKELTMHVSCEIPELNFRIHTRCFACRIDADGNLQSLEDGDGKYFIQYFV